MMLYQWEFADIKDEAEIARLTNDFDIHPIIAQILLDRNLDTQSKIENFFQPKLENLLDPFLMLHMEKAVNRVIRALSDGEQILVYGDYDVDGVTGVAILYNVLFNLGGKVSFFIPDRFNDGYGVSKKGINVANSRKSSLIITVDCGITAVEEISYANEMGIDVIVCDHHEPGPEIPDAFAILDPKLKESPYPFRDLAGCGVAFKFMQGLVNKLGYTGEIVNEYLDLIALGTSADIVPLVDENRILVHHGLNQINQSPRNGLFAILEILGLTDHDLTVSTIVFVLAPRLNAVGRMSNAKKAVHLLSSKSLQQSRNIARILENENKARKNIDEITFREADSYVENNIDLSSKRVLVLAKDDWHPGVIGIVASRLMEKYSRPTVLISIQDGMGRGSARSAHNFDIYEAFRKLSYLLENYGGHKFAAGMNIVSENIPEFDKLINELALQEIEVHEMVSKIKIDARVTLDQFDANFLNGLKSLAPFGPSNMRPVFVTDNLQIYGNVTKVGNNHLKVKFKQNGVVIDAIGYNLGESVPMLRETDLRLRCAYVLEENKWNGQTTIQMRIKDFEVQ
ncbi:MAG: single-stranded-DNA-specific exonuclease RecJ [Calditrichaceae bacterium]